jgi:hypothetical protein
MQDNVKQQRRRKLITERQIRFKILNIIKHFSNKISGLIALFVINRSPIKRVQKLQKIDLKR